MTYKIKTINEIGLGEIACILRLHHKDGVAKSLSESGLRAWAAEAEEHMANGNPPSIEIPAWASLTGATLEFTISDDGVDTRIETAVTKGESV